MKKTLMIMVLIAVVSFMAAQTVVFADDFSTDQSAVWTTTGQIGSSAFSVNRFGADWGARRNSSPAQLELSNDVGTTANVAGWVFANTQCTGFASPYNSTLSSNPALVTWSFNLQQIRTDPAGFASGSYGVAVVLAATNQTAYNAGTGYAVVLGQTGTTDPLRLAKFSAGLNSGLTNIISSNTAGLNDFGAEYLSVKVNFDPLTGTWELFVRNDGATVFADPLSGSLVSQGSAVDNTYTNTPMSYLGAYWQGSTAATQTAFFDNFTVQVASASILSVNPNSLVDFSYIVNAGPSPAQEFTVSGTGLTSAITVTAPEAYEISITAYNTYFPELILYPVDGVVEPASLSARLKAGLTPGTYNQDIEVTSSGAPSQIVSCAGTVLSPQISLSTSALTGFTYMQAMGPSPAQSFTVSGTNLTGNLILTAALDYEIAATLNGSYGTTLALIPTANSVPGTVVYIRLKAGLAAGVYNGEILYAASQDAVTQNLVCSGTVTPGVAPGAPFATAATAIGPYGFTANWNASENAAGYRLDVYRGSDISELFISEYLEGSSYNKAIEIYNGTGAAIDLSDYTLYLYTNGSATPSSTLALAGSVADGDVYVIAHPSANTAILAVADATSGGVINFNGDDALGLWKESTNAYVDIFGRIGEDPGDQWGTSPLWTKDATLVRKSTVSAGVTTNPTSGFPTLATEWDYYSIDTTAYLGSHIYGTRSISFVPGYEDLLVCNVTSYAVSGLAESTLYHYQVRAVNPHGTSPNSNEIDVTTSSSTAPVISVYGVLNAFSATQGTPSATQDYSLAGDNLTAPISISIPTGFEISADGGITYHTGSMSVAANFNGNILVRLTGSVSGTYSGNIAHSSTGAEPVSLWVSGLVTSDTVTAPTIQAYNITGYPAFTSITVEWTPGNGSRRVVKINTSNSFTTPVDGTSPTANPYFTGSGEQVIYNGTTEFVEGLPFNGCTVTNLIPNTPYWFRIYEYNGTGVDTHYLGSTAANNPKSISTTSSSGSGYYGSVYGYGTTLKNGLHTVIKSTHTTQYSYTAVTDQMRYTDEDPNNSTNLIEIYTGWSVPKSSYGGSATDWNKEHTWSKSHGDFGDVAPAGTDLHHLRPCDATVNSAKSNEDFDNGGNPYTDASPPSGYTGITGCKDNDPISWEPRDQDKGDVARMIMYMAVRYDGDDSNFNVNLELVDYVESDAGTYQPYYGKLATLLQWHAADPPDAWEARRNDRIAERQGNRNPFIDRPGYAARIWAPCPLYNSEITTTSFTGNWSTPIQATDYYLQIASDSLFVNLLPAYSNLDVNLLTSKNISGLTPGGTYYYRLRSYFVDDYGMWSPYLAVTLNNPVIATASLTPSQALEETNLASAIITFNLANASFADNILLAANFTLSGAPAGLAIHSVVWQSSTVAAITLSFTGADFDVNFSNFRISVAPAEITVAYGVTSSPLVITALVEGTASIALEGNSIKLTVTPVPGATSYRICASSDPYGVYTEISASGLFDPALPNVWRCDAATYSRRFYKVAAIVR